MKKLCILICAIVLISATYSVLGVTDGLNDQRNEISNKIEDSKNNLVEIQGAIDDVKERIKSLNDEIAQYQQEISELNAKSAQAEKEISMSEMQLKASQDKYEKQKRLLEQRIVAIYEAGETMYLDVLLSSNGIEDFLSRYFYLSEISKYDKDLLDTVQTEKQQLEAERIKLEKQQQQYQALANNAERTSVTLENTRAVRNSYLSQLSNKEKETQERIEKYEKDLAVIDNLILIASMSGLDVDYTGGEMAWPVPGYHTITSGYGMRIHPVLGGWRMHTGVDIGAPSRSNIVAANDGVVSSVGYNFGYGNYVIIDHGGGFATMYGHGYANSIKVKQGDVVKKGDVIMLIGSTGLSTGPHLHFEIRINGSTIDPLPYITSNYQSSERI